MMPIERWNWDDVRIFLAAMRAPSLRQAADVLGVSHPTARRRLHGLETRIGMTLFERRHDGLHATSQAAALLPAAEAVEKAMHAIARAAQAADPTLRGPVRVSMPSGGFARLLIPALADFNRQWPEVDVILQRSNAMSDLSQREADIAVRLQRLGRSPPDDLAGRRVGTLHRAVYGAGDCWIGWYGEERDRDWITRSPFPDLPSRGGFDDPLIQVAACEAGMGLTWLPCYLGDPTLPRITAPTPHWDIWVLVHPDLRKNPRLRVFRDFLVARLRALGPILEGRTA
ncbi:MAG: LysR family transcriptional regulator [Myxococcota bacterium]